MESLSATLRRVVGDAFNVDVQPELTRPEEQFGDYATNVALQLARQLQRSPREVAEVLRVKLLEALGDVVQDIRIAGPGFINVTLSDQMICRMAGTASTTKPTTYKGQVVVAEYSDPNPFKVLHAGHLYTSVTGYAIANLLQMAGATVHRVNFGGDVGLHVAKTMRAIMQELGGENPEKLAAIPVEGRSEWMAKCYVVGNNTYDDNESAKTEIVGLNKRVYDLHESGDKQSSFAQIYWTCRQWSYDYFDEFYARIGTPFEKYYPESDCAAIGLATVREQLGRGVYKKSGDAIVFEGEPYGLHTRVFVNSQGIPTYEAKDVGLIMLKKRDYDFDRSVIVTANEQEQYMAVVLKSIEQFAPELARATTHFTHGMVKLKGGVKMSSRKGNILRAADILDAAKAANSEVTGQNDDAVVLGAVKYAFLRQRLGPDLVYDPKESVSLEGNSGPYLQYAHARARSIIGKAAVSPAEPTNGLQPDERSLARKISEYPEVLQKAVNEMMPHYTCTYLYELAQCFNRFYEHNRVIGHAREAQRLELVKLYADVLKDGLGLLGITAPDHM